MVASKNRRVVLTGASGMLGFYLVRQLLNSGFDNLVLPLRKTSKLSLLQTLPLDSVQIIRADLRHVESWKEILQSGDTVIHAAATLGFGASAEEIDEVNRAWTKTIVDEALASEVRRFIYISSVAALNRVKTGVVTEEDRFDFPERAGSYGQSKYKAEKEVWRGYAEGLDVLVFNPSQIIGLGHYDKLNSRMLRYFEKLGGYYPRGSLGIVDVRDVAEAVVKAIENDDLWGKQFILNAENISYQKFINETRARMQKPPLTRPLPLWLHRYGYPFFAIGHWLMGKTNPFSRNYLRNLAYNFAYDSSASLEISGFEYRVTEETLDDWVNGFLQTRHASLGILPA